MQIACIIPTYNGKLELCRLLDSLLVQDIKFDLFVVDSSSTDGTRELALSRVESVTTINAADFNHGGTRQMLVDSNSNYDIYVFLTQDACLLNSASLSNICSLFKDPLVGAVCGRQVPHVDATLLSQHARIFNYPDSIQIKSSSDIARFGIKTAFLSNSFAAYRSTALKLVGGFPAHVIFAEDMYVAAKMLLSGLKIGYAGNAVCRHSHNYTLRQEFERYFDMGVFHAREVWIRENIGGAGGEGLRYIISELRFLGFRHIYLWPEAFVRNVLKLIGYKLGQFESFIPLKLKRKFSMYKRYWNGPYSHN